MKLFELINELIALEEDGCGDFEVLDKDTYCSAKVDVDRVSKCIVIQN